MNSETEARILITDDDCINQDNSDKLTRNEPVNIDSITLECNPVFSVGVIFEDTNIRADKLYIHMIESDFEDGCEPEDEADFEEADRTYVIDISGCDLSNKIIYTNTIQNVAFISTVEAIESAYCPAEFARKLVNYAMSNTHLDGEILDELKNMSRDEKDNPMKEIIKDRSDKISKETNGDIEFRYAEVISKGG